MKSDVKLQVVIVSQDVKIFDQISSILDSSNYKLVSYVDCHTLVRQSAVFGKNWGIVLIDHFFGQISSLGFVKQLKLNYPRLPVIVMSLDETSQNLVLDLNLNDVSSILKPLDLDHLKLQMDSILNGEPKDCKDVTLKKKSTLAEGGRPIG